MVTDGLPKACRAVLCRTGGHRRVRQV